MMQIVVSYDPVSRTISISESDFTTVEALGVLASAMAMIQYNWMREDDENAQNI